MRTDAKEKFGYRLLMQKDRREMANSYWSRMYGEFAPPTTQGAECLHGKEKIEFEREWLKMQERFKGILGKQTNDGLNNR